MPYDEYLFDLNTKLERGTQIIYVPAHFPLKNWNVRASWNYPNGIQPGFVTSGPTSDDSYFCRYWRFKNGCFVPRLRTLANSELTPGTRLIVVDVFNQHHVLRELEAMEG